MNQSFRAAEPPPSGRIVTKGADEELALFLEMRKLEKERDDLLLDDAGELDPPLGSQPGTAPIFKIASSAPVRKAGIEDFMNSDSEKNDYDWLLTPPGTPLFPSLDSESRKSPSSTATSKALPKVLKSRLSNTSDPPRNTASRQSTSLSGIKSSVGTHKPVLSGGPTHSASRPTTPNGRSMLPANSKPIRSSTPVRATLPSKSMAPSRSATPPRSATPIRSSTPTSRQSVPAATKPASRSGTPTRQSSSSSSVAASSTQSNRSSSVTRCSPTLSKGAPQTISKSLAPTASKSSAKSCGSSPNMKPSPKPTNISGLSLDASTNSRTALPGRSSSASRSRPGAPSSRSSSVEPGPNARPRRQSCSPSRGRLPNGSTHKGSSSVPPTSRPHVGAGDNVNPVLIGNKMVERIVNMRRLAPPKQDDQRSTQNNPTGKSSLSQDSTGFGRTLSKKSLDMALRHMDIRRSVPNSLRPLMTNIPASSVCSVRSGSTRSRTVSISDSPLATSSTASSEHSVNNNIINSLDAIEMDDHVAREKGGRCSPAVRTTR